MKQGSNNLQIEHVKWCHKDLIKGYNFSFEIFLFKVIYVGFMRPQSCEIHNFKKS